MLLYYQNVNVIKRDAGVSQNVNNLKRYADVFPNFNNSNDVLVFSQTSMRKKKCAAVNSKFGDLKRSVCLCVPKR